NHTVRSADNAGFLESAADTVLLKPGVMDPVAMSVIAAARDAGVTLDTVQTFRRYYYGNARFDRSLLQDKVLRNDAIEQILSGKISEKDLGLGSNYPLH